MGEKDTCNLTLASTYAVVAFRQNPVIFTYQKGRPTEKTEVIISKIEQVAAFGASMEEIAFYAGIHRSTLYRWMKEDPDLRDRIEELAEKPVLLARQTVVDNLKNDPAMAFKYLERKKKDEFAEKKILQTNRTLEDLIDESDEAYEPDGQPETDRGAFEDSGQAGEPGEVPAEREPGVLLGAPDAPQHNPQAAPEGTVKDH